MIASLRTIYNGPPRTELRVTAGDVKLGDFVSVAGLYGVVNRVTPDARYGVRIRVEDEITGRFAGESTLPASTPATARRLA